MASTEKGANIDPETTHGVTQPSLTVTASGDDDEEMVTSGTTTHKTAADKGKQTLTNVEKTTVMVAGQYTPSTEPASTATAADPASAMLAGRSGTHSSAQSGVGIPVDTASNSRRPTVQRASTTTNPPGSAQGSVSTAAEAGTPMTVAWTSNGYDLLRPTTQDAVALFRDIYNVIMRPAFNHIAWPQITGYWQMMFPTRTRLFLNMFTAFSARGDNPSAMRLLFADFIQAFCTLEMSVAQSRPEDRPGCWFNHAKYGIWCRHVWREQWRLPFWVEVLYAYRNEWAWGVDGGTRGLAGFVQAVGLFAHVFCRMLEKGWAGKGILYDRACWEMKEYLFKWAVRVHPPPAPARQIDATQADHGQQEDPKSNDPQARHDPSRGRAGEGSDDTSDRQGERRLTVGPIDNNPAASRESTSPVLEDDEGDKRAQDDDCLKLSEDNQFRLDEVRDDEQYRNDHDTRIQQPYSGGSEPYPRHDDAFPPFTAPNPEGMEGVPTYVEQSREDLEAFPAYEEPATTAASHGATSVDTTPRRIASQPAAGTSGSTTPSGPPRRRARANTNAAEMFDAEDADLRWFAEFVLAREM